MRCARPIQSCCCVIAWAFFLAVAASAEPLAKSAALVTNGGYVVTRDGSVVVEQEANTHFVPASIVKIATALTALEILGPAHRIKTEFFLRDQAILCIKGYGDPFLVSQYITAIAASLKDLGVNKIEGLVLDESFFELEQNYPEGSTHSENPYDAENSALSVNFNSLSIVKNQNGIIASGEPQTPILPLTRKIGARLKPGQHRINVSNSIDADAPSGPQHYAAELFTELLKHQGITVSGSYEPGIIQQSDRLIHTYYSHKTVAEMIRSDLKYSNNFVANQLLLCSGAKRYGPPGTWQKGLQALREILEERAGLHTDQFFLVEGSGLSRRNRITPAAMILLLEAFRPFAYLLPEGNRIVMKSGTLSDVFNFAGYFISGQAADPFVIMLNQQRNQRDKLLDLLHRRYLEYAEGK
jgi:D-alanyl-D-alanine carboxypeptidase/D-alanyl-D-alanine-endopeptidase (penicillin-binding protein 4)